MLDYNKALIEFEYYLKKYNLNDEKCKLKQTHTYNVVKYSELLAKELKLSTEDIILAKIIALLHDIGRFEQLKIQNSFNDLANVDHAQLAIKILFEDKMIRKFIKTNKYDNIILKAIENHNKLNINKNLNKRENLHAKILRDADKTDNFRICSWESFENIFDSSAAKLSDSFISDKIYCDFMNNRCILYSDITTDLDYWISVIALIYDYNFLPLLKYITENNFINILIDRIHYNNLETKKKMDNIKDHAMDYLVSKLK